MEEDLNLKYFRLHSDTKFSNKKILEKLNKTKSTGKKIRLELDMTSTNVYST